MGVNSGNSRRMGRLFQHRPFTMALYTSAAPIRRFTALTCVRDGCVGNTKLRLRLRPLPASPTTSFSLAQPTITCMRSMLEANHGHFTSLIPTIEAHTEE